MLFTFGIPRRGTIQVPPRPYVFVSLPESSDAALSA